MSPAASTRGRARSTQRFPATRAPRYFEKRLISSETASSQAFAASSPGQFVAATNAASFAGAIQITAKNIVFEPVCVSALPPAQPRSAPLQVKAQEASLTVRGERLEAYLISAGQGEQTLLEAHVSELGQILRVRTFVGYSAAPEDLLP